MKKAALLTPVVVLASFALARAASAYASDAEVTAALSAFRADYASKEDSVREKAVKTLGNTKHKRIVEALAAPLTKDSSQLVRRAAAAEIGAQWTPNAVKVLASALQPDDVSLKDVNAAIIKALGATSSDEAVPVLVGLLAKKPPGRSKSPPVANDGEPPIFTTTALKALTQIASPRAMDDALLFLVSMGKRGGKGSDDEYGKAT
ncbi:HEAT repeat domain-containing protein [bacterium]|nr:HEAT repeat domain-containing protein [bacterium]